MSGKPQVRMSREEIDALLAGADIAFVAWREPDGGLRARPMRYHAAPESLRLAGERMPAGAAACAVVDTYPTYTQIRGAMLGGTIRDGEDGQELAITRASGFDFSKIGKV